MTDDILGQDWNKEVGSPSDEKVAARAQFYEKRAELKAAINEDLADLELEKTTITAHGKYLFGALESAFGMKKAYKILKIASADGSGFNVDQFGKGDTVSIEKKASSSYLVKRNSGGDLLEKVLISYLEMPKEPPVPPEDEESPPAAPEEVNDVLGKRIEQVLGVSRRIVDGTGISIEVDDEVSLNPTLMLTLDGVTRSIQIQHHEGVSKGDSFKRGNYVALLNEEEFENFGEAVRKASLEIKPEAPSHSHFEIDLSLPLNEQWLQWETKIKKTCTSEGVTLEINGRNGRKALKLSRGNKNVTIRVVRNLSSRKKGDWTSEHCKISYQGESTFYTPLEAVNYAISQPFDSAPRHQKLQRRPDQVPLGSKHF